MTINTDHNKHTKLTRAAWGHLGRLELGILGTPCGNIQKLAFSIIEALSSRYSIAYADADHKSADLEEQSGKDKSSALAYGSSLEYTDKITFSRFDYNTQPNNFQMRSRFADQQLVLINGNHFPAAAQIIVIDPAKPLEKKLDKLSNVKLILLKDGAVIPEYLKQHLADWQQTPTFNMDDTASLSKWVEDYIKINTPPLFGLVLAGGKSTRMQQDKARLNYHGKTQKAHLFGMLSGYCEQVFVSGQPSDEEAANLPHIEDSFLGLGPTGGILSAFRQHPEAAWLVVACDLPHLSAKSLDALVAGRQPGKVATAFMGEQSFPEPLITIWEPKSYAILLQFLSYGYSCPRKALINSDTKILQPIDKMELSNVNTPEEYRQALDNLNIKKAD
jgi:molybdopterin-guanine dinucleotide biosynthesis protein A